LKKAVGGQRKKPNVSSGMPPQVKKGRNSLRIEWGVTMEKGAMLITWTRRGVLGLGGARDWVGQERNSVRDLFLVFCVTLGRVGFLFLPRSGKERVEA